MSAIHTHAPVPTFPHFVKHREQEMYARIQEELARPRDEAESVYEIEFRVRMMLSVEFRGVHILEAFEFTCHDSFQWILIVEIDAQRIELVSR